MLQHGFSAFERLHRRAQHRKSVGAVHGKGWPEAGKETAETEDTERPL